MAAYRAMSWGWSSAQEKILQAAWLGVLTHVIPAGLADEAAGDGLAWEMRIRRLPARVTVYFTLGLCLFSALPYQLVFAQVTAGRGLAAPATAALTAARRRLGEKPLESLFRRLCSPLSPGREEWSHVAGLLAVAWDGTMLALAGSPQNAAAFGRPPSGRKRANGTGTKDAAPHARLVALVSCGTRGLLDAAVGPVRGKGAGERALAARLLGSLRAGMLLLADRGFYSWGLWNAAAATGAHLLWRVQDSMLLPVAEELPDGSFLSRIQDKAEVRRRTVRNGSRRRRGSALPPDTAPVPAVTVRVIAFTLTVTADDGAVRTERYRLITTLLDWRHCPAPELAAAYARRWAIETAFREAKAYLRGTGRALRGRAPDLARQEIWALLAVYQAIRFLIARAAAGHGLDPARLSFTTALRAARDTAGTPRRGLAAALDTAETAILASPVPLRDGRVYPRPADLRRPVPAWTAPGPSGKRVITPVSQHATHTITITTTAPPTPNTTHQRRQAQPAANQAP